MPLLPTGSPELVAVALIFQVSLKIALGSDEDVLRVNLRIFQAGQQSVSGTSLLQDISSTFPKMNPSFSFEMVSRLNTIAHLPSMRNPQAYTKHTTNVARGANEV